MASKRNALIRPGRVPDAFEGIQVNYCKNPTCSNFGVPPPQKGAKGRPAASLARDSDRSANTSGHIMKAIGRWSDRWLLHPFPSMSEPDKAACYLTDLGDYTSDHLARLYQLASLHAIDRFFMQIRRRISLLERPIATASNKGRVWYGYSPYNPEVVGKMLSIFRVFYNYSLAGEDKKTSAMRLGLAVRAFDIDEFLSFVPPAYRDRNL